MCQLDPTTEQQLEATVKQFLDEGRMFTGYDVTIETRQRENVQMRHKDVRGGIHEIQCLRDAIDWGHTDPNGNDMKWQQTQMNMPGGGWAFVYHPETADPNQYQARGGSATPQSRPQPSHSGQPVAAVAAAAAPAAPSNNGNDSGGQNTDGTFSTDYRNRLMVRTEFVKELGLVHNDPVQVIMDTANNRILLTQEEKYDEVVDTLGGPSGQTQQIERNGDMRLYSRTLRTAGLDIAEDFVIETKDLDCNGQQIRVVEIRNAS